MFSWGGLKVPLMTIPEFSLQYCSLSPFPRYPLTKLINHSEAAITWIYVKRRWGVRDYWRSRTKPTPQLKSYIMSPFTNGIICAPVLPWSVWKSPTLTRAQLNKRSETVYASCSCTTYGEYRNAHTHRRGRCISSNRQSLQQFS